MMNGLRMALLAGLYLAAATGVPASDTEPATCATTRPSTDTAATDAATETAESDATSRPTTRAATQPTSRPTTRPTSRPAPAAIAILQALERAGKEHTAIRAEVFYRVTNLTMGDTETRTGWVAYRRAVEDDDERRPTQFRVHFDTVQLDAGPKTERQVDFAFDGRRLSIARHRIEQMTRYRLGQAGRQPMTLGKGPFPLPFGQRVEDMLKHFNVTTRPARGRLSHTKYLKLIPREEHKQQLNVASVEMWVDAETFLPVKIDTADKKNNHTLVVFRKVQTDADLSDELFTLPTPAGWRETVEQLPAAERIAP
ncbi:MAG: outer membrane lipoprotein carrier protein LolA [Phycisphaerae bacterium]|nr:outer membrane lipoprotein carrier protein LolA [Phycisphaerae bacterium]